MRTVTFDELIKLPNGTAFCFLHNGTLIDGSVCILGETVTPEPGELVGDFFYSWATPVSWNGDPPEVDFAQTRWGSLDYSAKFSVLSREDIERIRQTLQLAWESTPKTP